jgi:hypothetical protein
MQTPLIKLELDLNSPEMEESTKTASISEILDNPSLLIDSMLTLGQIQRNKTVYLQISVQELIFDSKPC